MSNSIIEVKRGLMWRMGATEPLGASAADIIARKAGLVYAERFVRKYDGRLVQLNSDGAVIRTRKPNNRSVTEIAARAIASLARRRPLRPSRGLSPAYTQIVVPDQLIKKFRRMRHLSPKRAELEKIYQAQKPIWHRLHPRCEFVDPKTGKQCRRKSSPRPHHKKKRGRHLCDVKSWMAICEGPGSHHDQIHQNEKAAKALGYLLPPDPLTDDSGQKLPPIITPLEEIC